MTTYKVTQSAVTQLLEDVRRKHIAIPELQRPFVRDSVKVRDLMDSLYKGYPVGYLITWQSIGAQLKGGQVAAHQRGHTSWARRPSRPPGVLRRTGRTIRQVLLSGWTNVTRQAFAAVRAGGLCPRPRCGHVQAGRRAGGPSAYGAAHHPCGFPR